MVQSWLKLAFEVFPELCGLKCQALQDVDVAAINVGHHNPITCTLLRIKEEEWGRRGGVWLEHEGGTQGLVTGVPASKVFYPPITGV